MSSLQCPHCGAEIGIFKARGGQFTARKENLKLLASLPMDPQVVSQGDSGSIAFLEQADNQFARAFQNMVAEIAKPLRAKESEIVRPAKTKEPQMDKFVFAIPVADGKLCSHFGHCEQFALIETEDGRIKDKSMHTPPPHEPGVLPKWLAEQGATVVIAGGMGARAQDLFQQKGIKVIVGAAADSPESLVNQYLADTLVTGANICDH
jgi:predicted Fe-Mo cluster-binding NifX family protein